jgi:molecular chaperone GrpE (heat shock protein)
MGMPDDTLDADFDSQMQGLSREAESAIEQRTAVRSSEPSPSSKSAALSLPQLLRPVVQGLEAVSRATNENTVLLKKLDSTAASNVAGAASATNGSTPAPAELSQIVTELRSLIEGKNGLNQSMFSALHQELKGYKDGFLLESVHRPLIRDLVSLFDDITTIQRQVTSTVSDPDFNTKAAVVVRMGERLRAIEMNLIHNLEFIAEVLNRLDVTLMDPHGGKLDKRTQRAVALEVAESPEQDAEVIRVVKRGFLWKDRILRAEEVVIKKWQEGNVVALKSAAPSK